MKSIISFVLRNVPRKYLQLFSHVALKILVVFYKGKKVQCSVCESEFKKFLPYGRGPEARDNALCPNCLSLERHRMIWTYLKGKTDFFTENLRVLHVAPEHCFIKRFEALPNLDYITADIESPLAKVKMDVHDIPFPDESFDVVFCNHVLEHVDDDIKVLGEFNRVLKPGGWAVLQSPIDYDLKTTYEDKSITSPQEREKHFGQDDHQRMYAPDYGERLKLGGFKVEEDKSAVTMPKEESFRLGYDNRESLYICHKEPQSVEA